MSTFDEANAAIPFRLRAVERQAEEHIKEYEAWRRDVDSDRRDLKALTGEVGGLRAEVHGLRRVIMSFAFVIAGSAITFSITVLAATGKL